MREPRQVTNQFELVVLAGARARQLLRGCSPRTDGADTPARLAALEVKRGYVRKVSATPEEEART